MTRTGHVWLVAAFGLSWAATSVAGQEVVRDPHGMFTSDGVTLLFDAGFFTEGPALGPDGHLYFSDITFTGKSGMQAGYIWRHDLASGVTEIFRSPSGMSNGLLLVFQSSRERVE